MFPAFIIIKILNSAYEFGKYAFLAFPERVRKYIHKTINSEYFKWYFLLQREPERAYCCLNSNKLKIVKLRINYGATNFNDCLSSNKLKIVKLGIKYGANKFHKCLSSNNLKVVKLGIANGAYKFHKCLYSNNLKVVKFGVKNGATNYDTCLRSNNLEIVKFGVECLKKKGESINDFIIGSNNINILLFLLTSH